MQFKTSSKWKHQVIIQSDSFSWDGTVIKYSEVETITGILRSTSINLGEAPEFDQYEFWIYLKHGNRLHQRIKKTSLALGINTLGVVNVRDVALELNELFNKFCGLTIDYRLQKYTDYEKKTGRLLLEKNYENGDVVSGTLDRKIFYNDELVCDLDIKDSTVTGLDGRGFWIRKKPKGLLDRLNKVTWNIHMGTDPEIKFHLLVERMKLYRIVTDEKGRIKPQYKSWNARREFPFRD